jgi:tetratricopeptide (TPR) repeat protein
MHLLLRHTTLAVVLICVVSTAHAITASEIYEQAIKSTVVVENIDAKGDMQSMGSGVVLADRDVVTNCHVVKGANQLQVRSSGKTYPATLHYSDWDRDVCSLSITGFSAPAVVVGSTKTLKVGTKVYAIGAPQGLELTLSDGIISSLREVEGGHYIQTTAAISHGSSGGGLFDENGALVGLTTFYLTKGQNLNFAVPVEWVTELAKRSLKTSAAEQPVTYWLNKTIEMENSKDWAAMLEHTRRWTKVQPGSDIAWFGLGNAYFRDADQFTKPFEAVIAYQQALLINPKYVNAWSNLGAAYENMNQPVKAIEAFQQGLRINPGDVAMWSNLGVSYNAAGMYSKSIEACQKALSFNPKFTEAWYNLGIAYDNSDKPTEAINTYQQVLQINPEHAKAWNNLGAVYGETGQPTKAIAAYQQALRINPEYGDAWNNLGNAYDNVGQPTKAIEAYKQALRIDPEDAVRWSNLGLVYYHAGQFAKAIAANQQALRINPENVMAWSNLGKTYIKVNQFAKAIEPFQQALRINPEYVVAWSALGIAYDKTGQSAKAIEAYQQVLRINPTNAYAWASLGVAYSGSGQRDKVLEVYKRLKSLNSSLAEQFFTLFVIP